MIDYAESHGLSDFSDLDNLAGEKATPIFLTNKLNGQINPSMTTLPIMTEPGALITISVNTRSGLETLEGGKQSPATGFVHEVNHAIGLLRGPGVSGLAAMSMSDRRAWARADDQAVISGPETKAAKLFGEPTRTTHKAKALFQAKCATCAY